MRLSELRTGEKGVIVKVLGHGGFRKRIVEMGFIKGKTVEVILNAPLKDPIKYRLLGYEISLRRQEADMIEVVSEQEARTMQNPYHGSITEDVPVSESELVALAKGKRRTINVALVGNPNCGKTSLFNIASGAHETATLPASLRAEGVFLAKLLNGFAIDSKNLDLLILSPALPIRWVILAIFSGLILESNFEIPLGA